MPITDKVCRSSLFNCFIKLTKFNVFFESCYGHDNRIKNDNSFTYYFTQDQIWIYCESWLLAFSVDCLFKTLQFEYSLYGVFSWSMLRTVLQNSTYSLIIVTDNINRIKITIFYILIYAEPNIPLL